MTKIYHNPRCRKSRETLQILRDHQEDVEIIKYLENPPSEKELAQLLKLLGINPQELVRTNEKIWKEQFKGKHLTDQELVKIMVENPILIERPIVVKNGKAALGRPPESVKGIL